MYGKDSQAGGQAGGQAGRQAGGQAGWPRIVCPALQPRLAACPQLLACHLPPAPAPSHAL